MLYVYQGGEVKTLKKEKRLITLISTLAALAMPKKHTKKEEVRQLKQKQTKEGKAQITKWRFHNLT